MTRKKILKDILKLHPELEQDKALLKKTVKFLSATQPKVSIDQKFKTDLGNRLTALAAIKTDSIKGLEKKPGFLHIFGGVFASLLAFFGLFYVFGDTLFYTGETPDFSEYETQFSDIDIIQQTKLEIRSTGGISEPSEGAKEIESQTIESQKKQVPNTIIINQDGASQIDVSQPQIIQAQKQTITDAQPNISTETTDISSKTETSESDGVESSQAQSPDFSASETPNPESDFEIRNNIEAESMINPAAGSMMIPSEFLNNQHIQDDAIDYIDEIEDESYDEILDEFTLRCDAFGGEVSITDEIRVCNIGDIVCTETDFLKGVCELGE